MIKSEAGKDRTLYFSKFHLDLPMCNLTYLSLPCFPGLILRKKECISYISYTLHGVSFALGEKSMAFIDIGSS